MSDMTIRGQSAPSKASVPSLLEFHSPTAALAVVTSNPGARGTIWVVGTLVLACAAAAALIPIDKVVTAPGRVVSQTATNVVQPLETAIVRSIEVTEGQLVKRGDVLARLDPTFATADLSALQTQVASLEAEVSRLQAEATGTAYRPLDSSTMAIIQASLFNQRQAERGFKNENYTQKISSLQSQQQRAASDRTAYMEQVRIATVIVSKRADLEKLQVGSQLALLDAQNQLVTAQRGLDGATATLVQATRDLQAMQAERDGYNQQWRGQVNQELTEQGRKLSDAREQLNKATLRRELVVLRAGQDSIVQSIARVSQGSVLQSGEQFFTLVPSDAVLEVEVNVPGSEAGFVHPGNTVTIKFDTFPFTQYGGAAGTVRVVSPDSIAGNQDDRQRTQQQAQPQSAPIYRSRITLDEIKLHDTPKNFRVVPGMPVAADIKVGERTLMTYLFSRVLPVFMDGMREP